MKKLSIKLEDLGAEERSFLGENLCQTNDGSSCLEYEDPSIKVAARLKSMGIVTVECEPDEVVVCLTDAGLKWVRSLPEGALASVVEISYKLSSDSEDGEDFQDVFVNGKMIGKLTWWTGATAGWHFEDLNQGTHYVCPLTFDETSDGELVEIPIDEVKVRASAWLLANKAVWS